MPSARNFSLLLFCSGQIAVVVPTLRVVCGPYVIQVWRVKQVYEVVRNLDGPSAGLDAIPYRKRGVHGVR